jgi:hypothetical protein
MSITLETGHLAGSEGKCIASWLVECLHPTHRKQRDGCGTRLFVAGLRETKAEADPLPARMTTAKSKMRRFFAKVDRILFRALPYAHADRLVSVGHFE